MRRAVDALLDTIAEALAAGDEVVLSEFGRFYLQPYPGRKLQRFDGSGHYRVEGRRVPAFRSSAALRRRIKENSP
jgi:nucleoid DNA-binding protein